MELHQPKTKQIMLSFYICYLHLMKKVKHALYARKEFCSEVEKKEKLEKI